MTGDARRLLAWKGLGETPATVFTIAFPPTEAEETKKNINYWNKTSLQYEPYVCQRTSLNGCAYSSSFYGSSLKKTQNM